MTWSMITRALRHWRQARRLPPPTAALRALFDAEWYSGRHPECAGTDAWRIFLEQGLAAGHDLNPLFDGAWYRRRYGAAVSPRLSAVEDWLLRGVAARRDPGPLFSTAWYLDQNPDVAATSVDPLAHYLRWGWREKRDPSPVFDSAWYFARYPDAAAGGLDARAHFMAEGAARDHSPCRLFNTAWYRRRYGDMLQDGRNPLLHYLEQGAAAGLDPGPRFSTRQYLAAHPEVRESGENPLVHHLARDPSRGAIEVAGRGAVRPSTGAVSGAGAVVAELAAIEPDLVEVAARFESLPAHPIAPLQPGMAAWRRLYASLRTLPRAVVLAGSAEAAQGLAAFAGLLILVTEGETLGDKGIEHGADWRCLAELEDDLDAAARMRVAVGLVNALRPAAVLVAGSAAGWEMLSRHGNALARHSALFATDAPSPFAGADELLLRHFRSSIQALTALYGEDLGRLQRLAREHGLPPGFATRLQPAAALLAPGGFAAATRQAA